MPTSTSRPNLLLDRGLIVPVLVLCALFGALPFLWALLTSLKQPVDAFAVPPSLLFRPTLTAYAQLFADPQFTDYLVNTVVVTLTVVALSVLIGCLGGYALARYTGIGSSVLLGVALLFYAVPRIAILLPYYRLAQMSGLYDTRTLLILVLVAVNQPFTIWMFERFFREIPEDLERAAMVDGCTRWQAFLRVVLPIMGPAIATTTLFTLLSAYNEFLLPVILTGPDSATLPVLIANYAGSSDVRRWPVFAAAAVAVALPLLVVVVGCQKFLVRGLVAGAVKG